MTDENKEKIFLAAKTVFLASFWVLAWIMALFQTKQAVLARLPFAILSASLWLAGAVALTAVCSAAVNPKIYFALSVGLSFAYLLFFPLTAVAVLAIAVLFFGFWRSFHRAQFELANNIKFSPASILRGVSRMLLLTFMLVVSFQIYGQTASDIASDEGAFYANLAGSVTRGVMPILERQLPGFEPQITLDDYLISGFSRGVPEYSSLPAEMKEDRLSQSRRDLASALGITAVSGGEPLSKIAELAVGAKLSGLAESLKGRVPLNVVLPAVWAVIIFFLLRILALVLDWAARFLGLALFWILRKLRFFKITTVQILAERISM